MQLFIRRTEGHPDDDPRGPFKWGKHQDLPVPVDEKSAINLLHVQIKEWRQKGWHFPANLLQHFVEKKGPTSYRPTEKDIEEVRRNAGPVIKRVLEMANPNRTNQTFSEKGHIFILDVRNAEGGIGYMVSTYGGFDFDVKGGSCGHSKPILGFSTADVAATVTLTDFYSFPPGALGWRNSYSSAYGAANYLQEKHGYKPFTHTLTFKDIVYGITTHGN